MSQPENPHQAIYNIAALCAAHGLTEVVLSPGSRSAPLTLAFARHPATNVRVVPDERAAAFIGLGIAQARRVPTVLVCTSGTAGLNYAPAVAEAYYQQVPLLILTADRPPEWIDQLDGQTIRQNGMYGAHVKGSYTFPTETTHPDARWHANRLMNEAINLAKAYPPGPVHVNIPLREPLYPVGEVVFEEVRVVRESSMSPNTVWWSEMRDQKELYESLENALVIVGQHQHLASDELGNTLPAFAQTTKATIVGDVISNVGSASSYVTHHDVFLSSPDAAFLESLRPELLITFGNSNISKSLKQFLRKHPPQQHWHLQENNGQTADVFGSVSHIFRVDVAGFLRYAEGVEPIQKSKLGVPVRQSPSALGKKWQAANQKAKVFLDEWLISQATWTEFQAIRLALSADFLPNSTALHLANSMAVRYANILGVPAGVEVFANRGTSGIDGCTSTAVGYALAEPEKQVVLITGDVAFFYDRNAFWHNYPTPNLRVVLLNNHGGGIFRLIDGPRQQPELDEFFETRQQLTAENLCRDFRLPYFPVDSWEKLEAALPVFFGPEGAGGVLEIQTDSKVNAAFFEEYRAAVKQAFS
ncbi:MAG: 2-succinyl-5-enolpyruvyl-6-hydroxy-3-cyclohexene-1-carboxylic-acid synthase [Hymenobacteraceae bacterium]|nr:2-succinyl-5-enolpyruvyl-6-hydroxy-3-cyclohexene-1-carboxylic-acid synthase [Hymenobacteraceae bacterium]